MPLGERESESLSFKLIKMSIDEWRAFFKNKFNFDEKSFPDDDEIKRRCIDNNHTVLWRAVRKADGVAIANAGYYHSPSGSRILIIPDAGFDPSEHELMQEIVQTMTAAYFEHTDGDEFSVLVPEDHVEAAEGLLIDAGFDPEIDEDREDGSRDFNILRETFDAYNEDDDDY